MSSLPPSDPTSDGRCTVATLSPERQELHALIATKSAELAGLYEMACVALVDPLYPGRLRILCHCVREVLNRLLDIMGAPQFARWDSDKAVLQIVLAWEAAGLPLQAPAPSADPAPSSGFDPDGAALPEAVVTAVRTVVSGYRNSANHEKRVDALLETTSGASASELRAPLVREWREVSKWFVRHVHAPYPAQTHPADDVIARYFNRFEGILRAILQPFYKTTDDLDAILEAANS